MTDSTGDNTPDSLPRSIPIDTEHLGIRVALPAIAVVGFLLGFALSSTILANIIAQTQLGCIPPIGGVAFALLFAFAGDRLLKRLWPSGRMLTIDNDGLQLQDTRRGQNKAAHIQWNQRVNAMMWRFKVKRSSAKVQKGWLMLSMKLVQDETAMTIYSFLPEKEASALAVYDKFIALMPSAALDSDSLSLREKGEQKRLLSVERERWEDGAELQRQDFVDLVTILMAHISDWNFGGSS